MMYEENRKRPDTSSLMEEWNCVGPFRVSGAEDEYSKTPYSEGREIRFVCSEDMRVRHRG